MDTPIPWHRLFGIALTDLFSGRPWRVELEKELALKSQRLDVLIIERRPGETPGAAAQAGLPDGLEGLAARNVLTYKSHREALDAWALDELLSHFVTYRKLASAEAGKARGADAEDRGAQSAPAPERAAPTAADLLPESDFRLYAVATRFPDKLAGQIGSGALQPTPWRGVHDLRWGGRAVRLIVLSAIAKHPRNAPWELFSVRLDRFRHGLRHYRPRQAGGADLLGQIYFNYRLEIPQMAYTMEDFRRDSMRVYIERWPELPDDIRQAIVDSIPVEERLRGLDPQERLRGLDPQERLRGLDPEELVRGLDPDWVEAWLRRIGH